MSRAALHLDFGRGNHVVLAAYTPFARVACLGARLGERPGTAMATLYPSGPQRVTLSQCEHGALVIFEDDDAARR